MHGVARKTVAAERAAWLADLTQAIDEAQQVAWRISSDGSHPEAMDLYVRLELARTEVESLRRSDWVARDRDSRPDWAELLPGRFKLPRSWS